MNQKKLADIYNNFKLKKKLWSPWFSEMIQLLWGLMLANRLWCRPNLNPTLAGHVVFVGVWNVSAFVTDPNGGLLPPWKTFQEFIEFHFVPRSSISRLINVTRAGWTFIQWHLTRLPASVWNILLRIQINHFPLGLGSQNRWNGNFKLVSFLCIDLLINSRRWQMEGRSEKLHFDVVMYLSPCLVWHNTV